MFKEFFVEDCSFKDGQWLVYGRTGTFPLKKGDLFTSYVVYQPKVKFEDYIADPIVISKVKIDNEVVKIESYEKELVELPKNTYALVTLAKGKEDVILCEGIVLL
jgi:hypothetical protein